MDDGGRRYEIEMKMRMTGQPEKQVWEGGKEEGTEEWVIEALVSGGWSGEITVTEKPSELHSIYYQRNGGKGKKRWGRGKTGKQDSTYCSFTQCGHEAKDWFSTAEDLLNKNEIN